MRMEKRKFRIGELAKHLNVERFVIRFWEKEFNLNTDRSYGGQRFYTEKELEQFKLIKDLLYNQGFTISGAKKQINQKTGRQNNKKTTVIASKKTSFDSSQEDVTYYKKALKKQKDQFEQQITELKNQLRKLRDLL